MKIDYLNQKYDYLFLIELVKFFTVFTTKGSEQHITGKLLYHTSYLLINNYLSTESRSNMHYTYDGSREENFILFEFFRIRLMKQ